MNSARTTMSENDSQKKWQFVFIKNLVFSNTWTAVLIKNKVDSLSLTTLNGTCNIFNINPLSRMSRTAAFSILSALAIIPTDELCEQFVKIIFKKIDLTQPVVSITVGEIYHKLKLDN